ncbi:MAG TPA: prepilin-type N-terminal cleavage/methylation domain-containing protein, partial [Oscillospiraceae bacterium]|nr:prepilin-type N-terminal cleavage/methylation domain-containing protein [Oscillospiraceae bacterium]
MFMWLKSKKGFTLVELMIVLALLGLGAAALFNLFTITYKSFNKSEERYIKQEEAKRVAELLQTRTNIAFAFGAEIYDTLNVIPP